MVKQIFDDLQKLKCYSCDPSYPLKLKDLFIFIVNHDMQKLSL